ncbi:putative alcohol dehydrogenase [Actinoplanes missouriensis 431]|uniref:Putative alcohol dehydrogenase n=1 Tax=Actinoplanes missouriensis (strain ATCC 14538 / DSM 43046 / CBS 188.64 / JCM 3121 / NBRC 102363 / NCIMB 12654 / NRRL B-3342 / UNCC 431) TaxID=512565 RepID=I0H0N7_ACTM4|nr:zinc-binding dehydrogenase [Actinoplanes missouriensis]BAL86574.1 putative alcohol dehydrogenase [Actinoplanes missouriensis 431]
MLAAVITAFGGPGVFALDEIAEPAPGPDTGIVDVTLAGVNYADVHRRRGEHEQPPLPAVLGADVVGRRRADGRRVAALLPAGGGYAQVAAPLRRHTVPVPDAVTDEQALAVLEQGLTAWHSLHTLGRVDGDDLVVVTAGAGGVGHLAVQLARWAGARVVALASSPSKRAAAVELGAHAAVDSRHPDLGSAVRQALGAAPTLVLDSVGGETFERLRAALAPFGRIVAYGGASDVSTTVAVDDLMTASTGVLGFRLQRVLDDEEIFASSAARLFHLAGRGVLRARIGGRYPLGAVGQAHADLEGRSTTGKLVIDVHRFG